MSSPSDDVVFYEDMMDDEGLPLLGFRLLSFMDENGKVCYRMAQFGDGPTSHLIGLLEMAKLEILTASKRASGE